MKKRTRIFLFLFAGIGALFLCRQPLLELSVKTAAALFLPKSVVRDWTYETVKLDKGRLVFTGAQFVSDDMHLAVDQLEIDFHLTLSPFYFEPHLSLTHPQMTLLQGENASDPLSTLAAFVPTKHVGIKWDMQNGVLQCEALPGLQRLFFLFKSGEARDDIGTLSISYDPSLFSMPVLTMKLNKENDKLHSECKIQHMEVDRLFHVLSFLHPLFKDNWQETRGEVEMHAKVALSLEGELQKVDCAFDLSGLSLLNQPLGVQLQGKHVQGTFSYPAEKASHTNTALPSGWRDVLAHVEIEDGQGQFFGHRACNINGRLIIDPTLDPTLDLTGTLVRLGKEIPFSLLGKGGLQEKAVEESVTEGIPPKDTMHLERSFWVELMTRLETRKKDPCSLFLSLCAPEKDTLVVQADLARFAKEELEIVQDLLPASMPRLSSYLTKGTMDAKMTALVKGESLQITHLKTALRQGEIALGGELGVATAVGMDLEIEDNALKTSTLSGVVLGVPAKIELREWLREEGGKASLFGSLSFQSAPKENIDFGLDFVSLPALDLKLFSTPFTGSLNNGWVRSEKITAASYTALLKKFNPQLTLTADGDLFGTFDKQHLMLSLQATNVLVRHPHFDFYADAIGEKDPLLLKTKGRAHVVYHFDKQVWEGIVPLSQAHLNHQGFAFDGIEGEIHFTGPRLWVESLSAHCQLPVTQSDAHISGLQATVDFNEAQQHIAVTKVSGQILIDQTQSYTLSSDALLFSLKDNERWEFDLSLKEGVKEILRLAGLSELSNANRIFTLDEKKCHLGRTTLEKATFSIKPDGSLTFEVKGRGLKVGQKEIAAFHAKGDKREDLWTLERLRLDALEATCSFNANKERVTFSALTANYLRNQMRLEGSYLLNKKQFVGKIASLSVDLEEGTKQFGLKSSFATAGTLTGSGGVCFTFDDTYSNWKADANLGLSFAITKPFAVSLQTEKTVKIALTSEGKVDVSGMLLRAIQKDKAASLDIATFAFDAQKKTAELKQASFSVSPSMLQKLTDHKLIPSWAPDVRGDLPLSGNFSLTQGADGLAVKGELTEGRYYFAKQSWDLKQVHLRYGAGAFHIGCKTAWNQVPLFAHLQIDTASTTPNAAPHTPIGMLHVREHPQKDGLKLFFKQKSDSSWSWEKVDGSLSGLEVHLTQNGNTRAYGLNGSIKGDLALVSRLLSKEAQEKVKALKLGKGYELVGSFTLFENDDPVQFEGSIKGRDIELLGYSLRALDADARIAKNAVTLRRVTLKDEAGDVLIKTVKLEERDGEWYFDVPTIQVQEFKPSFLRPTTEKPSAPKPLIVKKLTFNNLSGKFSDPLSFTGDGELSFTNAFKKESHFLDQPIEMIKNLGLDPGLLTPVYGEITYRLEEGKIQLTDMLNAYSDGQRSEFYLVDDGIPSYLDLDGNLHVNLRMKQNVMLKVTEPFMLTIRGTWKKPRYGLE